jgi:hypothetical protein
MRRSARCVHGHGKTRAVRYRHELRSLSSLGLSDAISPASGRHERGVDEALREVEFSPLSEVSGQGCKNTF